MVRLEVGEARFVFILNTGGQYSVTVHTMKPDFVERRDFGANIGGRIVVTTDLFKFVTRALNDAKKLALFSE